METGALLCTFGKWVPDVAFERIYVQKLLPQLTYDVMVAALHLKTGWYAFEKTQRLSLRLIANDY